MECVPYRTHCIVQFVHIVYTRARHVNINCLLLLLTTTMEKIGLETVSVPVLGLGTYQSPPGVVGQAVEWALEAGYRYFDCAIVYGNEAEIGEAINKWIKEGRVDRRDLFITTKLPLFALR